MRYLGLLLAAGALAADPEPPTAPMVVSALATPGGVVFDAPISINWDSLLPANLRRAALAADPAGRRRLFDRRTDYGSEATFPVSLPARLKTLHYYLFDSIGVRRLRPTDLLGRARIEWVQIVGIDRVSDTDQVAAVGASGGIRARIGPAATGGFVMIAADSLRLTMERSDFSADSLLAERGADYPNRGTPFWRIIRQYQVRQVGGSGDRWAWVQWAADSAALEGGCLVRLGLFRLGGVPTMVSSVDAGCDP